MTRTSVVATSGYFASTRWTSTPTEINARWVIYSKTTHRAYGSHDYSRHQEAATCALLHIFALAKHFNAKNSEGKASNKYANHQSEYAGNLCEDQELQAAHGHMGQV